MENLEDLLGTNRITTDTDNDIKRSYLTEKAYQNESEKPKKLINKPDTFGHKKNTSMTTNKKPRSSSKKDEESQQFKIPSVPKKLLSHPMDARREKAMRKYKEYTSAFGDNKLKGKNIGKLTNQCSTEDFEAEILHIEDTLSDADRLLMMKMGYKAFNQFIEDKHQYLPFINQMDLRGLGSNSEKTWMNVKDTFQELVIKYDIGRGIAAGILYSQFISISDDHHDKIELHVKKTLDLDPTAKSWIRADELHTLSGDALIVRSVKKIDHNQFLSKKIHDNNHSLENQFEVMLAHGQHILIYREKPPSIGTNIKTGL
ncbi:hypothetical protein ACTFIY_006080 [Dictyostelium cf. discoideum]